MVCLCLIASCCILKQCNKIIHPKVPRERRVRPPRLYVLTVDDVQNGAMILSKSGRHGRKTARVGLVGIAAPSEGESLFVESEDHLRQLAGGMVKVEVVYLRFVEGRMTLASNEEEIGDDDEVNDAFMGRRMVLTGIVYGEAGANLNLEQVKSGMARCLPGVPDDWTKAETEAKEQKLGVWK